MNRTFLALAVLAACCGRATAQDLAQAMGAAAGNATTETRKVRVTYLGVTAKSVDAVLGSQLNLPDGTGLAVTFVDAKGPAANDLRAGDVLQKLDDQLLINPQQLVTLIRLHKAGDSVTLTVLRGGKPVAVAVKLAAKEKLETTLTLDGPARVDLPGVNPQQEMGLPGGATAVNGTVAMAFDDGIYSANVVTEKDGHKQMTVKDKTGKLVGEGPVDTDEQWGHFSADVRKHLEVLHQMLRGKR